MINRKTYYKQPSAGAFSFNTNDDMRGRLEQLVVNPSATDTTYDVTLTNDTGDVVYTAAGNTGTLADDTKVGLYGIYTFAVASASASNKTWTVTFIWEEITR